MRPHRTTAKLCWTGCCWRTLKSRFMAFRLLFTSNPTHYTLVPVCWLQLAAVSTGFTVNYKVQWIAELFLRTYLAPGCLASFRAARRRKKRRLHPSHWRGWMWRSHRSASSKPLDTTARARAGAAHAEGQPVIVDVFNDSRRAGVSALAWAFIPSEVDGSAEEGTPAVAPKGIDDIASRRVRWARAGIIHILTPGATYIEGLTRGNLAHCCDARVNDPARYDQEVLLALHGWDPYFTIDGRWFAGVGV